MFLYNWQNWNEFLYRTGNLAGISPLAGTPGMILVIPSAVECYINDSLLLTSSGGEIDWLVDLWVSSLILRFLFEPLSSWIVSDNPRIRVVNYWKSHRQRRRWWRYAAGRWWRKVERAGRFECKAHLKLGRTDGKICDPLDPPVVGHYPLASSDIICEHPPI